MWSKELRKIAAIEERILDTLLFIACRRPASKILIYGENTMGLNVTAGAAALLVQLVPLPSGTQFDSPADLELTCDDAAVTIAPQAGDTTGTLFTVTVQASDANTTALLDATGLAGGKQISGTATLTITPATPANPNPATSIGIVAAPVAPATAAPAANRRAAISR